MRVLLGNDNICIINVNNTFSRWWMISLIMFLSFIKFTARAAEYYSRKKQTQSIAPNITVNIFTHSTGTLVKRQADGEKAAIRVQQKHRQTDSSCQHKQHPSMKPNPAFMRKKQFIIYPSIYWVIFGAQKLATNQVMIHFALQLILNQNIL